MARRISSGAATLTRRGMLISAASAAAAGAQDNKTAAKARAFALIGDESHNSDYIRSALTSTLVQDAGLAIDFTDEEKELSYEALQRYRILIIFRDGLRFPDGYTYAMHWRPTAEQIVSVPPIQKKMGGRG